MPTARPAAAKTKERTLNGDTVWRNSPSIGAEQEKTSEEVLPIYTYRDYKPKPSIVYTRHEEETNDLIDGLRSGCGLVCLFALSAQGHLQSCCYGS